MAKYLTKEELTMDRQSVNLQIVLGIPSCNTKGDVCELLDDVREHEKLMLAKEQSSKNVNITKEEAIALLCNLSDHVGACEGCQAKGSRDDCWGLVKSAEEKFRKIAEEK